MPFVVRLADGRAVPVASYEYMMIAPSERSMIVCQPGDSRVFIDVGQISSVDVQSGLEPRP